MNQPSDINLAELAASATYMMQVETERYTVRGYTHGYALVAKGDGDLLLTDENVAQKMTFFATGADALLDALKYYPGLVTVWIRPMTWNQLTGARSLGEPFEVPVHGGDPA